MSWPAAGVSQGDASKPARLRRAARRGPAGGREWQGVAIVSDEAGLLDAVVREPDDDLHRMVYADWLEERGQGARAEFIRVQVELARPAADRPRRAELLRREKTLLARNGRRWAKPFHP